MYSVGERPNATSNASRNTQTGPTSNPLTVAQDGTTRIAPAPGRGEGGKGFGRGIFGKRHSKQQRRTVDAISEPSIRRMARRGGCKRISAEIYPTIRSVLKERLREILKSAIELTNLRGAKTVTADDIVYVLRQKGAMLYGFGRGAELLRDKMRK